MTEPVTTIQTLFEPKNRTDALIGLCAMVLLGGIVFLLKSPLLLGGLLAAIISVVIIYLFADYFPLVIFLFLAFSLEIQVTGTTRLTVPTEILILVLFLLTGFDILRTQKIVYRRSPLNIAVVCLYLIMAISLTYSQAFSASIKAFIRDTGYILTGYYIIANYINSERRLKQIVYGGLIVHSLLILYGFATQAVGGIRIYDEIANPFFVEHCIYAAFITITFSFLLAYLLEYEESRERLFLGGITALFGIAILLTFVRAAWMSIALLLIFYLYHFRKRRSAVDLILILLFLVIGGIVIVISTDLGKLFLQRFDTITDFQYVANYDRLDRWLSAWHIWLDNPILGVGWGAYPDIYNYYVVFPNAYSTHIRMGAHNLYLEIMAETGIIGISIFLFLIYQFYRQSFILLKKIQSRFQRIFIVGMQGAMITYLFHAFLNNLGPSDKISLTFWFLLGMVPAMNYLVESSEQDTKRDTT